MVRHYYLCTLGNEYYRLGNALGGYAFYLVNKYRYVECNTVPDDVDCVFVKYTGRKSMKCKLSVFVLDSMACVGTALEPDYYIGVLCQHISDFTFAFVAPIGTHNCFNHLIYLHMVIFKK